jgi:hypothetical protein
MPRSGVIANSLQIYFSKSIAERLSIFCRVCFQPLSKLKEKHPSFIFPKWFSFQDVERLEQNATSLGTKKETRWENSKSYSFAVSGVSEARFAIAE